MANLIFNSAIYGTVGFIPYPVSDGATETLEYYTDCLQSYTNKAEERNQMRALPRQAFQYKYRASFANMQEIANAVYANIRGKWLIPLWFELQSTVSTVGKTVFNVDTTIHDLRANTHALLFQSICKWQVVTISAITASTITCDASNIAGQVYIVPFRIGFQAGNVNALPTGYNTDFTLNFSVDDVLAGLTDSAPQYNGYDFYDTPYSMDNAGAVQILQTEDQVQFSTGNISHSTAWTNSQYSKAYIFDGQGSQEMRDFKNYFYRRAGRFRPFYSPSFESNLQNLSTGNVVSTFKFKDEGYTDNLFATRKRIGFLLPDGSWQTRGVTACAHTGGGVDQLSLDAPLNVKASDIMLVSFVSLNRLDTDRVELTLSQNQYFRTSANVIEIGA